jgi:hypothetical protein
MVIGGVHFGFGICCVVCQKKIEFQNVSWVYLSDNCSPSFHLFISKLRSAGQQADLRSPHHRRHEGRLAFPLALVGSIVGEFIGGNEGIGYLILSGQFNVDTPLVFAALLSITAFTTLGIAAIGLFERIALKWRPSRRKR